jgi:transposase
LQTARVLAISRNTVRWALASHTPPKYERKPAGSIVDAVEPRIRELLQVYPMMPATVWGGTAGVGHLLRTVRRRLG